MTGKTRILIADDHAIVRMGLASLLERERNIEIVGEATDGKEAVSAVPRLSPDIVIMDLMMPKMDGISATQEICRRESPPKVIVLTTYTTADGISQALANGASGALLKGEADTELIPAIGAVAKGRQYVSRTVKQLLASDPPAPSLTDRQLDILQSVTRGLTNKDIAKQFGISEITVRNHLSVIFEKIGAASRTEAASIALRKQLLKI